MNRYTLLKRLSLGWTYQDIITFAVRHSGRSWHKRVIAYCGESKSIVEWSRQFGISPRTLQDRIAKGIPVEIALRRESLVRKDPVTGRLNAVF